MKSHNILGGVHIYFTSTIKSPGFEKEQETKPEITKKIEGSESSDPSSNARAITLLNGIENNQLNICSDFLTRLFYSSVVGISKRENIISTILLSWLSSIIIPIWLCYIENWILKK